MSMKLAECNFNFLSAEVRANCLEDCKNSFTSKYISELHSVVKENENSDAILNFAHSKCNEWRKSKEIIDAASQPSNLVLLATISLVGIVIAAKLLSSKKQEAKNHSTNPMSSIKAPPLQETRKTSQPTNIYALFGLMVKS